MLKGRAQKGQMCNRRYSCSVVEITKLDAPYVIAHELGHRFPYPFMLRFLRRSSWDWTPA